MSRRKYSKDKSVKTFYDGNMKRKKSKRDKNENGKRLKRAGRTFRA